ncbi:hypothetical protein LAL4801_06165 [Roseibium aggregatum]|uniref:Uncharacterized protein n=1 Tax=Roseibium aggregatum TaxID=187304 RepID=A0A0M6YDX1_9HYPH|nr:hypothetical protein LAL4801_06165 [Roseibium aggregatum]
MLYGLPWPFRILEIGQIRQIEALDPRSDVGGRDLPSARFLCLSSQNAGKGFGCAAPCDDSCLIALGEADSGVGEGRLKSRTAVGGPPGSQNINVERTRRNGGTLSDMPFGRSHSLRPGLVRKSRSKHRVCNIIAAVFSKRVDHSFVVLACDHRQTELVLDDAADLLASGALP